MGNASALVYECQNFPVAVARRTEQLTLVATDFIAPGDVVIEITGLIKDKPSRFSVQVGIDQHVDLDDPAAVEANPERYLWRFLNHRCTPNTYVKGTQLIALEPLQVGDEVVFNYNANEYEMATPFECWCDTHRGTAGVKIRGYKYLSETERFALRHVVSHHVLQLVEDDQSSPIPAVNPPLV